MNDFGESLDLHGSAGLEHAQVPATAPEVFLGNISVPAAMAPENDVQPIAYDPEREGSLGISTREELFRFMGILGMPLGDQNSTWTAMLKLNERYTRAIEQWSSPDYRRREFLRMQNVLGIVTNDQHKRKIQSSMREVEKLQAGTAVGVPAYHGKPVTRPFMMYMPPGSSTFMPVREVNDRVKRTACLDLDGVLNYFRTLHGKDRSMSQRRQQLLVMPVDRHIVSVRRGLFS